MIRMGDFMNKKGFTLIELLGIFSITALILLIAVPSVSDILTNAKESEYKSFESNIFLAAEAYIGVNNEDFLELKQEDGIAYISLRTLMQSGYLKSTLVDPQTNVKVEEESHYTVIVTKTSKKTFNYELIKEQVYHPYSVGDEITFDPGDGVVRTWNVIKESGENDSILVIMLNTNLGNTVPFNSTGQNVENPITALEQLKNSTSQWNQIIADSLRLITNDEIKEIVQNETWAADSDLDISSVSWLSQNTNTTSIPYGYWTNDSYSTSKAWYVGNQKLSTASITSKNYGIRPVITIAKYK